MHLSALHVVGLVATILLIIGIGVYSGRKVKSAADFSSGGGKAGSWIVCGAIMGEALTREKLVSFLFIWVGVILYVLNTVYEERRKKSAVQ